jgi:hypothetical protein
MFARFWVPLLVLLAGLVLVLLLRSFVGNRALRLMEQRIPPYALRDSLLTNAECSFFGVLKDVATQAQYYLFAQVPLGSLVYVDKETESFQLYQKLYQNTIDHKTLDFVLVTKDTLTPALAIELDDSSRQREGLLGRDRQVDHVLSRTGLPLLHVRAGEAYDSKVLADAVDAAIKRGEAG